MDDKTEKNFTKHYAWVDEYNREAVLGWMTIMMLVVMPTM